MVKKNHKVKSTSGSHINSYNCVMA